MYILISKRLTTASYSMTVNTAGMQKNHSIIHVVKPYFDTQMLNEYNAMLKHFSKSNHAVPTTSFPFLLITPILPSGDLVSPKL